MPLLKLSLLLAARLPVVFWQGAYPPLLSVIYTI